MSAIGKPSASLIITTYNRPDALSLVLASIRRQILLPVEVLIADDGSSEETNQVIAQQKGDFPIPLHHIWHEDDGFRRSAILNKTIARTRGHYIIQVDGDVILHRNFVRDHLALARKGFFLTGSRVLLNEIKTEEVLQKPRIDFHFWTPGMKNRWNAIYLPFMTMLQRPVKMSEKAIFRGVRGSNISYWKKDILSINGYDEEIKGWGREDSDLIMRFFHLGLLRKPLRNCAIQYHLQHEEFSRDRLDINDAILESNRLKAVVRCENGLSSHL